MDYRAAAKLAESLMAAHDLRGWTFGFNRRKRAMGLCRYEQRRIELSLPFVIANDEASVRDTILHEIAHALAGPAAGHGPRWQHVCRKLGAEPRRCGEAVMPKGRWRATCPGCGREYHRHRRPLAGRTYSCRACGPQRGRIMFRLRAV